MVQDFHERRLYTIEEADWDKVSERDVYDIAAIFIREHGLRAARQAGEWADLMLDRGDRGGHATWRQILWAVEELNHQTLREAQSRAPDEQPCAHVPRLYSGIDTSLERVIHEALVAARDTGQDDLMQTEQALRAARNARPALSLPDALSAVEMARRR